MFDATNRLLPMVLTPIGCANVRADGVVLRSVLIVVVACHVDKSRLANDQAGAWLVGGWQSVVDQQPIVAVVGHEKLQSVGVHPESCGCVDRIAGLTVSVSLATPTVDHTPPSLNGARLPPRTSDAGFIDSLKVIVTAPSAAASIPPEPGNVVAVSDVVSLSPPPPPPLLLPRRLPATTARPTATVGMHYAVC